MSLCIANLILCTIIFPQSVQKPNPSQSSDGRYSRLAATQPGPAVSTTNRSPRNRMPDWIQSAGNLHAIGMALIQRVIDKGEYPDKLADLTSTEIDAERLICPIDGKPYVYLKPADTHVSPHSVVAYEATASSRGMINILFADDDVEGFREVNAKAIIIKGRR